MTEPWDNWPEPTVEADEGTDSLSRAQRATAILASAVLRRSIERDEARDRLDHARAWAAALESRLAEVHDILTNAVSPADRRCRIRQAVRLIEADLT